MAGKPSAASDAAKQEYERAIAAGGTIPSARQLAARHDLAESSVHRADWYHGTGTAKERAAVAREKAARAALVAKERRKAK